MLRESNRFVAAFMGAENVLYLEGSPQGDSFHIAAGPANAAGSVALLGRQLQSGAVEARFRPEREPYREDDICRHYLFRSSADF